MSARGEVRPSAIGSQADRAAGDERRAHAEGGDEQDLAGVVVGPLLDPSHEASRHLGIGDADHEGEDRQREPDHVVDDEGDGLAGYARSCGR